MVAIMSTFDGRINQLIGQIGGPHVDGIIEVNQVYAHRQHEDTMYKHPHGGQAKYLEGPLFARASFYLAYMADHMLDTGGPAKAMEHILNDLADKARDRTPIWGDDLRRSYHLVVTVNGAVVYDKPPEQHRLTQQEIREKHRLLGPGYVGI
jgi:hypothetical protein